MRPQTQGQPDEDLLRRFSAGDRAAFETLARRHEQNLLGLALGFLRGDRTLACDAVQETWVRVVRFAGTFAGHSSFKTWVCRILINQCRTLASLKNDKASQAVPPKPSETAATPPQIEQAEHLNTLRESVSRLDEDKQAILLLCYHDGMTHEVAAEILGLPLGTLKSRLHSALRELREQLSTREAV